MENENTEGNKTGKYVTSILALVSAALMFFMNLNVFRMLSQFGYLSVSGIIYTVFRLLVIIAALALFVVNIVMMANKKDKRGTALLTTVLCMVTAILIFLYALIWSIIDAVEYGYFYFPSTEFILFILCVGLMIACLICNKKFPVQTAIVTESGETIQTEEQPDGYYSLVTHVLLLLFIGFIWQFIWIYRVTKYLNSRTAFNRNPTSTVLLSIFVPFYTIYWTYKAAQETDALGKPYGKEEIATICLVCEFFVAIASPILIQKKLNDIIDAEKDPSTVACEQTTKSQNTMPASDTTAENLKKYKELLDEGAITQEEYDAVKARYLEKFKND